MGGESGDVWHNLQRGRQPPQPRELRRGRAQLRQLELGWQRERQPRRLPADGVKEKAPHLFRGAFVSHYLFISFIQPPSIFPVVINLSES